jgi:hypothetical protein
VYYDDEPWTWRRATITFLMLLCLLVVCVIVAIIFATAMQPEPYRDPEPPAQTL